MKRIETESFTGILWSGNQPFTLDIMQDLWVIGAAEFAFYKLGDKYERFARDIYDFEKNLPMYDELLPVKLKALERSGSDSVFSFQISVPEPKYYLDPASGRVMCSQIKTIKNSIRGKYGPKIEHSASDALLHISDRQAEVEHTIGVLGKYSECRSYQHPQSMQLKTALNNYGRPHR